MTNALLFAEFPSPLGEILVTGSAAGVHGLHFVGQRGFPRDRAGWVPAGGRLDPVGEWLSRYFAGDGSPYAGPLEPSGTPFQQAVWRELQGIPAGSTRTYRQVAEAVGRPTASRAVGAAIGRNPISLLIPCHRVVGQGGTLTGYAGGLDRKAFLLRHERARRPGGDAIAL